MEKSVLINDLNDGREEGLVAIYRLYHRPLLYFSMRYVHIKEIAEDIVADTFVKAWDAREGFDHVGTLRGFLYVSAKNACLNHLRNPEVRYGQDSIENLEDVLMEDSDIFLKIVRTELLNSIFDEVSKLPEKQQEVFRLTFLEDMTVEEIAEKLKISATAVYANRSRALANLRELLKASGTLPILSLLNFLFFK